MNTKKMTVKKKKTTPATLPWFSQDSEDGDFCICESSINYLEELPDNYTDIAMVHGGFYNSEANAKLIIKAVNNHKKLVKVVQELTEAYALTYEGIRNSRIFYAEAFTLIDKARNLLEHVKGKKNFKKYN